MIIGKLFIGSSLIEEIIMETEQLHLVILGGTGFVGSAIMRRIALLPPGSIEARVLVRSVKGKSLSHFPDVTVIEGSLPDIPPSLFPKERHVVVHLATKQIDHDRSGYTYNNVLGTRSLLRMLPASTMGLIYASSTSVYGQGPHEGVREKDARLDPKTDLAKSRAAAESAIISAMSDRRKSAVILRPRFILGLEDRYTLPAIIKMVKAGFLIGSGQQAYSVIDVDDYAEIIVRLARRIAASDGTSDGGSDGGICSVSTYSRSGGRCSVNYVGWTKQIPAIAGICVSTDSVSAYNRAGHLLCTPFHVGYQQPLSLSVIVNSICETLNIAHPKRTLPAPAWRQIARLLRLLPLDRAVSLSTRLELIGFSHFFDVSALTAEIGPEIMEKDPVQVLSEALKKVKSLRVKDVAS